MEEHKHTWTPSFGTEVESRKVVVFSCPCRGTALVNFAKPEDADKVVSSVRKAGEGVDLESLKIERIDVVTLTDGSRVNHYYVEA